MSLTSASLSAAGGGPGQPAHSRFYEQQGSRWSGVDSGMYGPYGTGGGSGGGTQQQQQQQQPEPLSAHQMHQQQMAQVHAHAQAQARHAQHQASVQQGVSQLQSAAAHTNGATVKVPAGIVVPQGPGTPSGIVGDAKAGKGPVEFNHAISYVNKIKVSLFSWMLITCRLSWHRTHSSVEPICATTRNLQTIPRNSSDIPTRVKADSGCLFAGDRALQNRARSPRGFQAVSPRIGCPSPRSGGSKGGSR